jgi:hypothetical protein
VSRPRTAAASGAKAAAGASIRKKWMSRCAIACVTASATSSGGRRWRAKREVDRQHAAQRRARVDRHLRPHKGAARVSG